MVLSGALISVLTRGDPPLLPPYPSSWVFILTSATQPSSSQIATSNARAVLKVPIEMSQETM